MDKLKIMMLIPELTMGGAQNSFARLAWSLSKEFTVIPIVFDEGLNSFYKLPQDVLSLGTKPAKNKIQKLLNLLKRIRSLSKLKNEISPIACISFLEGADYLNVLTKRKELVVLSIRGSKLHDPNMHAYYFRLRINILIPFLYKKADSIVTVNKGINQELIDQFDIEAKKIHVIYNYIDKNSIDNVATDQSVIPTNPFLLFSGRLAHEKGIYGIIKVYSSLLESFPELRLILLGDGPEKDKLISFAKELNLSVGQHETDNICFVGSKLNTNLYVEQATASLLNSVSEGFPNSMAESLLKGKFIVTSDCPYGPRELFELGEGKEIVGKRYPIETRGGILLPPISEATEGLWVNSILQVIRDKRVCDIDFRNRFSEKTSEKVFLVNWKKALHCR